MTIQVVIISLVSLVVLVLLVLLVFLVLLIWNTPSFTHLGFREAEQGWRPCIFPELKTSYPLFFVLIIKMPFYLVTIRTVVDLSKIWQNKIKSKLFQKCWFFFTFLCAVNNAETTLLLYNLSGFKFKLFKIFRLGKSWLVNNRIMLRIP